MTTLLPGYILVLAGRPHADGELGRGPLPVPRPRRRRARQRACRPGTSCSDSRRSTSSSGRSPTWSRPRSSHRPKQPYRAPDAGAFFGQDPPPWVADVTSRRRIERQVCSTRRRWRGSFAKCRRSRGRAHEQHRQHAGARRTLHPAAPPAVHRRGTGRTGTLRPPCPSGPSTGSSDFARRGVATPDRARAFGPESLRDRRGGRGRAQISRSLTELPRPNRGGRARWSPCPAASTPAWWRRSASPRSGRDRVFGLHMPERESSADTLGLSQADGRFPGHRLRGRGHLPDPRGRRAATDGATTRSGSSARSTARGTSRRSCCPAWSTPTRFRLYSVVVLAPDGTQTHAPADHRRPTSASSRPPTSSSGCARCSSTTTPTG